MDTKLCEYVIAICELGSVAAAADSLYLTQSALNQQLHKLEQELGTPLFVRVRNHWVPTEAGQLYIENARKMVEIKRETYSKINDLAKYWNSRIRIGLTNERGMEMFADIYGELHRRFPDTVFQPIDATVEQQNQMLETRQIDISFQTIQEHRYKAFRYQVLMEEPFILCIPSTHPLASLGAIQDMALPTISLREFEHESFAVVKKTSTMRAIVDALFARAGFVPHILLESAGMRAMWKLTATGQCCCIIPRYYAVPDPRISCFLLGNDAKWEVVAVTRSDHYLSAAAKGVIELASAYWQTHLYSSGS
ncbi:MAG: LysR family transcriptional regulator [Clostridia bacterium]|nr:LysR family transcriptional regulator [Clostridia bacterium]